MESLSTQTALDDLVPWVQAALDQVTPGQFLLIEYLTDDDLPVEPYAQAALDPGGWHCEVVSDRYLPRHRWPIDHLALSAAGWRPPGEGSDNYWVPDVDLGSAATLLVRGLMLGRGCTDPDRYAISVGTFPSGPHGGEPLPALDGLPLAA